MRQLTYIHCPKGILLNTLDCKVCCIFSSLRQRSAFPSLRRAAVGDGICNTPGDCCNSFVCSIAEKASESDGSFLGVAHGGLYCC